MAAGLPPPAPSPFVHAGSTETATPTSRSSDAVRPLRFWRKSLWGLIDQAFISVANAAGLVVLARALPAPEFGRFVLAYTALLIANSAQSALITSPHNVLGAARRGEDYRTYTTATAATQLAFALLLGLGAAVAFGVATIVGGGIAPMLAAMIPAAVAWQLQEFLRRVLYTEGRLRAAVCNDLISYGGQIAAIAVLWRLEGLTGVRALYALAGSSVVACGVGAWQLRASFARRIERGVLRENWHFGKWLAGATLAASVALSFYFYTAAALAGAAAAGALKAAQVLLGPLNILVLFLGIVLPIRLAKDLELGGRRALHGNVKRALRLTGPLAAAYAVLVIVFAGATLQLFYGSRYSSSGALLVLFAFYTLLVYAAQLATAGLSAQRRTRDIYRASLYSLAVTLTVGWPLVAAFGAKGAGAGLIFSGGVGLLVLLHAYRRALGITPAKAEVRLDDSRAPTSNRRARGTARATPLVYVVVLNWNGWPDTAECLASLRALQYPNYRVAVVDNGSTDDSDSRIRDAFPDVTLLRAPTNLGFSGGNNLGIRHALEHLAELVWILNNDTTVAADALDALVDASLADDRVGIAGSVLYYADEPDRIQVWGGGTIDRLGVARASCAPEDGLDFVCGASMLVRSEVFEDIGLLDEHFFFFMEDVDFSRTATSRGWRLAVADGAAVWHKVSASINHGTTGRSRLADRHLARATGVFIGKHSGPLLPLVAPMRFAAIALRRVNRRETAGVPALAGEFARGLRSGFGARRP